MCQCLFLVFRWASRWCIIGHLIPYKCPYTTCIYGFEVYSIFLELACFCVTTTYIVCKIPISIWKGQIAFDMHNNLHFISKHKFHKQYQTHLIVSCIFRWWHLTNMLIMLFVLVSIWFIKYKIVIIEIKKSRVHTGIIKTVLFICFWACWLNQNLKHL